MDANNKPIIIGKPIYYYSKYIHEHIGYELLKSVVVDSIHEHSKKEINTYGYKYHCFLNDTKGFYVDQCRSDKLTTNKRTALRIFREQMSGIVQRLENSIAYLTIQSNQTIKHKKEILKKLKSNRNLI